MQEPREPESPRPNLVPKPGPAGRWRSLAAFLQGPPRVLLPALLLVVVELVLLGRAVGDLSAPVPGPASDAGPGSAAARAATAQAAQPGTRVEPTAIPIPTPNSPRPLVVPLAPRITNSGPAPVRKPGIADPDPSTDHVIVVDGDSGAVLFQRNALQPIAPASLTKIMTAILAIQYGNLSEHVTVDVDAGSMAESTVMGLEPWSDVTLQDLLYGLMLASGNDAALAIAQYIGGSNERFVQLMNDEARWLGLRCTRFANPHGLDATDHFSCPADMVTMARYGMQYQEFRTVASTRSYWVQDGGLSHTLQNLNPLLGAYPWADGVKTGLTDNAGRALVGTAVKNGHRVYVAFMRSESGAAADGSLLLDWAFDAFDWAEATKTPAPNTAR